MVYDDRGNSELKALTIDDIYGDGKQRILLATSNPNAKVIILIWNGKSFDEESVGQIPFLFNSFNLEDNQFYSMSALSSKKEKEPYLIISGMMISEKNHIGWETTVKGFIVEYAKSGGVWKSEVVDGKSILGADANLD